VVTTANQNQIANEKRALEVKLQNLAKEKAAADARITELESLINRIRAESQYSHKQQL
jgi:cupin superfamily acireductone dioxygenase involved in methionine salvage